MTNSIKDLHKQLEDIEAKLEEARFVVKSAKKYEQDIQLIIKTLENKLCQLLNHDKGE